MAVYRDSRRTAGTRRALLLLLLLLLLLRFTLCLLLSNNSHPCVGVWCIPLQFLGVISVVRWQCCVAYSRAKRQRRPFWCSGVRQHQVRVIFFVTCPLSHHTTPRARPPAGDHPENDTDASRPIFFWARQGLIGPSSTCFSVAVSQGVARRRSCTIFGAR